MADPQSYRPSNLPTDPGVYRFFDENDKVIYVGKAKNLKNRINSYFGSNLQIKTRRMVKTATRVDWTIVKTELEALQLEFTWIKQFNPDFNVQFKDDKSYPYLAINLEAEYPRIYISRSKKVKGTTYFGPYSHAWALRSTFETITKIYPVRTCTESNFKTAQRNKRQCLLGDIGKCAAPCVSWISAEEHKTLANNLANFLAKKSPSRSWIIDRSNLLEGEEIISAMIGKVYSEVPAPREIIVDQLPSDSKTLESWLSSKNGNTVSLVHPLKGEKLEIVELVKRNAHQALIQYLSKRANDSAVSGGALSDIAEQLELAELPLRIECFDISNIQGTSMVASMVVFEDGKAKKSDYRRFSINDEEEFDDTRAIAHVITRRFKRYLEEKDIDVVEANIQGSNKPRFAYPPQLVIVDGGKPQVNAAAKALSELGISDIAICGLAKRLEEIWILTR